MYHVLSKCFATSATVLVQGFRLFGCSAVRRFGCSAVRLVGCSAVRLFFRSVVRLFGVWVQRVPKSRKMKSGGVENRRKSWSGEVLWALGGLMDDLVRIFCKAWQQDGVNERSWDQVGSKLRKLGPSWQQVAAKSCQDGAQMASLVTL